MCLRSGHWLSSLEVFIRILTCLSIAVLVSSDGMNLTAELNKLESRLVSMTKKANTKNIDYFVLSNKLDALQQKIGEYQDQDRRMIIQINGLPYITAAYLYKVVESLSGTLQVPVRDEDITLLQSMTKFTDEVFRKTGRKVYPIIMGMKTRKLKWAWLHGLRNYLIKQKNHYKAYGLTVKIEMGDAEVHSFSGVTIHEHLGPQKRVLFKAVKRRCTEMDYQDMWFNDTQIYVKKRGYDPARRIINIEDMYKKITRSHWSRDNLLFRHDVMAPFNYDHDNV